MLAHELTIDDTPTAVVAECSCGQWTDRLAKPRGDATFETAKFVLALAHANHVDKVLWLSPARN